MKLEISQSQIFLFALISFILGITLASLLSIFRHFDISIFLYFLFLIGFLIFILTKDRNFRLFGLLIIALLIGIVRYQLSYPKIDSSKIQFYNEQKITFVGQVSRQPDIHSDKVLLTIKSQKIIEEQEKKVSGKVLINVPLYSAYQYGDVLKINCRLRKPADLGKIPYHEYLARYDIYSTCSWPKIEVVSMAGISISRHFDIFRAGGDFFYRQILSLKNKIKNLIDQNFTEPQGSIISALLVGLRRDIPQEVNNWFSKTGTSHILAISGLHLTVMIEIISFFLISIFLIPRQKAFWPIVLMVILYVILVGAPSSIIRAALMGLSGRFAEKIGRPQAKLRLIILAAGIILIINPKVLAWDIGFQLSFMAVLGMNYCADYFNKLFTKFNWRYLSLGKYLSTTLSAQIFTLPLILYYFGNLSLIAPLANLLVVPILPFVMLAGFCLIIFGLIWSVFAQILVWPIWLILTYIIMVTKILAGLPYFSFNLGNVHWSIVCILYIIIIAFTFKIQKKIYYGKTFN